MKDLKIGLFGFGVVGEGIYKVLQDKVNLGLEIKKIVIKDATKVRNAPSELFSIDRDTILNDPEIEVVVELIDDAEASFEIVSTALKAGKHVVSGNKKMIASHLVELIELQNSTGKSFLYEAAVCGSIPILRNLEEYFDNDLLHFVKGVVNGSTNYILTKMAQEGLTFGDALSQAQTSGFAESDPTMDIEGFDAAFKLQIITLHAFGVWLPFVQVDRLGINQLRKQDFQYAKEKGWDIKLLATSVVSDVKSSNQFSILPTFVRSDSKLASVRNEYNGVVLGSHLADEQFFQGKGAGRYPTSSAVLSDLSALKYDYKYSYKKGFNHEAVSIGKALNVFISHPNIEQIPQELFVKFHEKHEELNYAYAIGEINCSSPVWKDILKDSEFSIIAFEN